MEGIRPYTVYVILTRREGEGAVTQTDILKAFIASRKGSVREWVTLHLMMFVLSSSFV